MAISTEWKDAATSAQEALAIATETKRAVQSVRYALQEAAKKHYAYLGSESADDKAAVQADLYNLQQNILPALETAMETASTALGVYGATLEELLADYEPPARPGEEE